MKISVVIPTLNEGCFLQRILPPIPARVHEVIVVDGGSLDNTAEIALSLPQGIVLERRQEETGLTGLYPQLRPKAEDAG